MEVVRNQVNYMGLVEVLHIRKAGFVYRGKFEEFLGRYKCLCPDTWPDWTRWYATACEAVDRLVRHLGYGDGDYEIGRLGVGLEVERRVRVNRFRVIKTIAKMNKTNKNKVSQRILRRRSFIHVLPLGGEKVCFPFSVKIDEK